MKMHVNYYYFKKSFKKDWIKYSWKLKWLCFSSFIVCWANEFQVASFHLQGFFEPLFWLLVNEYIYSPLDSQEVKPVNPKGNQPWIFTRRTDAGAGAPIIWPPDRKTWLTRKNPDATKDRGLEEKRVTEDEMVGWYHWLNGHEFEQTLGDSEGQGILMCCSLWDHKELDIT